MVSDIRGSSINCCGKDSGVGPYPRSSVSPRLVSVSEDIVRSGTLVAWNKKRRLVEMGRAGELR